MPWKHEPLQSGACRWFFWREHECLAWICEVDGTYSVGHWGCTFEEDKEFSSLDEAKMYVELMFG